MIGEQEGDLYKLKGHLEQALIHDLVELNELLHRRLAHVHYRALPIARKAIEGLLEFQVLEQGSAAIEEAAILADRQFWRR